MKNTIAIVCSAQKDRDGTLLKADYTNTNLEMCWFFFVCCWKENRSSDMPLSLLLLPLFFFEVDLNALEYSVCLIVTAAASVITIGAIVSV